MRASGVDGKCEQPGCDALSGPADRHPDELVLDRQRRPTGRSSATRTSSTTPARARWRSSRSTARPRATTRASSSSTRTTPPARGRWSSQRKVPDAFIFHAAHGHFHFPLAVVRALRGRRRRRPRRAGDAVAQERLLHRRLLHLRQHGRRTPGRSSGSMGSCADPLTPARHVGRRGRRVRLPRSGPGDPVRRRARRHVLVPRDHRPEQRHQGGRRVQQRDRRQGHDRRAAW